MKYIFDTSFLVATIFENDSLHQKAWELWENISSFDNDFYMNENIYIEILTVCCYKGGMEKSKIVQKFLEKIGTNILFEDNNNYINFFFELNKKISIQDASVTYDSDKYGYKILSFDEDLLKISSNHQSYTL